MTKKELQIKLIKEYKELKTKMLHLENTIINYYSGVCELYHDIDLLEVQLTCMESYAGLLFERIRKLAE